MLKKFINLVLTLSVLCAFVPCIHAAEIADSGECGKDGGNLTWTLDSEGTLTISGEGNMADYLGDTAPWYKYKDKTKAIIVEGGVTSVGNFAFSSGAYTTVTLPDSVTSIGDCAFNYSGLQTIHLSDNITHIGGDAFYGSEYYRNSDNWDDESALYIGNHLIYTTTKIDSPSSAADYSVKEDTICIADSAFNGFVANVYIPESVTCIGSAFDTAYRLASITVDADNRNYYSEGGNLFTKDKTTLIKYSPKNEAEEYEIPNTVKLIAARAFSDSENLKNIIIPNTVTYIDDYAFNNATSLTSLHIPSSVKYIGDGAIDWCDNLTEMYIEKGVEEIRNLAWLLGGLKEIYYSGSKDDWNNISIENKSGWFDSVIVRTGATGTAPPQIGNLTLGSSLSSGIMDLITVPLTDTEYDSEMLTVFYKDGVMVDIETTPIKSGDKIKDIPIPENKKTDSAKVFIWSSLNSINPLCEIKDIKLISTH